jgi:hypothetical protein
MKRVTEQDASELVAELEPKLRRHVDLMVLANREIDQLRAVPAMTDGELVTAIHRRASLHSSFRIAVAADLAAAIERVRVRVVFASKRPPKIDIDSLRAAIELEILGSEPMEAMRQRVEAGAW